MEESNFGLNTNQQIEEEPITSQVEEAIIEKNYKCRKASVGFLEADEVRENTFNQADVMHSESLERRESGCLDDRDPELATRTQESLPSFAFSAIGVLENEDFKYIGEIRNDLREGFGVCYYKNGTIFKGTFKNDRKEGWGIEVQPNGDQIRGETIDDTFNGYCELVKSELSGGPSLTCGHFRGNRFTDIITVSDETRIYEGEVLQNLHTNISIGKLVRNNKKNKKIFMGEIQFYKDECGYGVFLLFNQNTTMYLCEIRNRNYENYYEMFNSDGISNMGMIRKGVKQGLCFSFSKDGKVAYGKFTDNYKNGPFITFSNCHNIPKSSVRLEMYHLDFRSKSVDKMEALKKYLFTNYPEYSDILNVNYTEIISKMNAVITEEMASLNTYITENV
jgi:hypothetical protein